ncbi:Ger(x)C family spore germination protein [Paenibacillus mesophilus]|uniref:Ger(x)C family spore germination protein n=1 Tax=Paenibacillus mesophilus TaxID=2582849 RepID=UPI001EE41D88|nr:Ger(x)C family spore germination protein [Paenibacillus mesophilus]
MGTNRLTKAVKLLGVVLVVLPLLTGCWDRLEIEERAVVLGISIDTASPEAEKEEEEVSHLEGKFPAPKKEMIRVAVQIALPGKIPLGPGESGGGKGGAEQTVWVIEVVGHTIDDALMNLQQQVSGRLFFGHLRVIVVSEDVAKKGMENLNDYFRRNSEVRRMAWMMISKGKAQDLMKAAPKLERVPTLYLMSTLDDAVKMGKLPEDYIGMFWSNSSKKGQEGFLPYVEIMKEQNVELSGLAYFKGSKMAGTTKPLEIGAYMGIKGVNPAGYRGTISLDGSASNTITLYATNRTSKIDVQIKNGLPKITVTIINELNIEEKANEQHFIDQPDILKEIEREDEKGAVKLHEGLVKETQEKGADIFGFGEYVRAKEPQYWNEHIKTKEGWQEMYKDISIEVKIDVKIRRVGMKAR